MAKTPDRRDLHRVLKTISVMLTLLVVVLLFALMDGLGSALSALLDICSTIAYGILFAYLLNPFVRFVDRRLVPVLQRKMKTAQAARRASRVVGVVFAFLVAGLVFYLLLAAILPQLGRSIAGIVNSLPAYYRSAERWVLQQLEDNPEILDYANIILNRVYVYLENFLENDLLGSIQTIARQLTTSVYSLVVGLVNMFIGLVLSIYILMSKDQLLAQAKKLLVALCRPETADRLMDQGRQIDQIFNGFVIGKLLDSLIIGVLCYIGVLIMGAPYGVLIATVIGVTNLIPYFGPFLGTIPCALLILLDNPLTCVYFVIFIVVLQQVDSNLISPRIMSSSLGISGFWILVSITLGGGLFGIVGMVIGVPVFAVLYMMVGDWINRTLRRRGRPIATARYQTIRRVADLDPPPEPPAEARETSQEKEE